MERSPITLKAGPVAEKQGHWHQALPEHDALYVRVNLYQPTQEYALRLRTLLTNAPPKNVILDLRHNDGGSTHLHAEFLRTMITYTTSPDRHLYVLIGRRTYSATGNLVTQLEQLANAVFVGEPSSECCTFYASPSPFTLPFSKLQGRMSTMKWSLSQKVNDFRREIIPQFPVQVTAKEYFSGRDPVLDTVFRLIKRGPTN
jgi:hypothetical protein